jgi:hypothetical protein
VLIPYPKAKLIAKGLPPSLSVIIANAVLPVPESRLVTNHQPATVKVD